MKCRSMGVNINIHASRVWKGVAYTLYIRIYSYIYVVLNSFLKGLFSLSTLIQGGYNNGHDKPDN